MSCKKKGDHCTLVLSKTIPFFIRKTDLISGEKLSESDWKYYQHFTCTVCGNDSHYEISLDEYIRLKDQK